MWYESTRGKAPAVQAAEAIVTGLAPDGGLYVPKELLRLGKAELEALAGKSYGDIALAVIAPYLSEFPARDLASCLGAAYAVPKFDSPAIAPLHDLDEGLSVLELWHGPTAAFKDMALQVLPRLIVSALRATGNDAELVMLVATSGDTGKAALEGFRDVPGTRIIVFYPEKGVSEIQRLQMITQEGDNVHCFGVEGGNFDEAQAGVKAMFADRSFVAAAARKGFTFSSANSINWGRLVPQIAYYVAAYVRLVESGRIEWGERVNVCVPTGNFGNILAAYYARAAGLPLARLICASNANNVLADFFATGVYDRNRPLTCTMSPSMDIIVSSNLERLLFELSDRDARLVRGLTQELAELGRYRIGDALARRAGEIFWGGWCSEEETRATIQAAWREHGYLVDPHTAVALNVYGKYRATTRDATQTIVVSTASPFKFNGSVVRAVFGEGEAAGRNEFELLDLLASRCGLSVPLGLAGLAERPVLHGGLCRAARMRETVAGLLGLEYGE